MAIRKGILIGLIIIFCAFPVEAFQYAFLPFSEPDGFRGIKWGTDISTLKDMELIQDSNAPRKVNEVLKEYKRNVDVLKIGDAQIDKIIYTFRNKKFYHVEGYFRLGDNWKTLRDIFFKMFGEREIDIFYGGLENYYWRGDNTCLNISFSYYKNKGEFRLFSISMTAGEENQKRKHLQQKAREREGF